MSKNSPLLQPIQVGNLTFKNRIMFPPLTTGYEERDGSMGTRSLAFYERLAKGGAAFVVMAVGSKKNTIDLSGVTVPVVYAGDCAGEKTAGILEAIRGGYHAANNL